MLLLGLGILLFSGYAITLRGRHLEPRKAVHLLGEQRLIAGGPAALRLIGWDLKWDRPLSITRVNLKLLRKPSLKVTLARLHPANSIVHLNVKIPAWPAGPAILLAEIESELGPLTMESQVWLDPYTRTRLRMVPPDRELSKAPVLISEGAGHSREPNPLDENRPSNFVLFPGGGRLTSSHTSRLLIRVLDSRGRPVTGDLRVDDQEPGVLDPEGFAQVAIAEGRSPGRLRLAFEGDSGRLAGELLLSSHPTQLDLAVDRVLVRSGQNLGLQLRSLSSAQSAYLEAWWPGGWWHTSGIELIDGRASSQLAIPPEVTGPLLIRVRGDPFGLGQARREKVVVAGGHGVPTPEQALAQLRKLPADQGFWQAVGVMSSGERWLSALLSRVKTDEAALPELQNGSQAERALVAGRKADLQRFGLGFSGVVSALAWLVVAWLLLGQVWRMRSQPMARKRSWRWAVSGLAVVTLALGGGWFWLYWGG